MSEENVEIIRDAYERWNRGDFGWATVVAPEFEYVASSGFVGLSGAHRGLEGFTRMLEQFWGEFDEAHAEPSLPVPCLYRVGWGGGFTIR